MSRQNDIDKLQAEIVGAYRNFKPTGETRRIVDKAYTDLESADARIASLEAENMRLRNQQEIVGEALMRDPPFDVYHGVDLHETASAAAEDDGRCGDIASRDYFAALVECCAQALLGGGHNGEK